ncbi:hypothetical protein NL108_006339 [Boleophthalmus pectinirostris]|nr:hypothetical protein NL108_006339 [Boleophthalmus pectinirostris]
MRNKERERERETRLKRETLTLPQHLERQREKKERKTETKIERYIHRNGEKKRERDRGVERERNQKRGSVESRVPEDEVTECSLKTSATANTALLLPSSVFCDLATNTSTATTKTVTKYLQPSDS